MSQQQIFLDGRADARLRPCFSATAPKGMLSRAIVPGSARDGMVQPAVASHYREDATSEIHRRFLEEGADFLLC